MKKHTVPDPALTFKPQFSWPDPDANRDCPKCGQSLEMVDKNTNYFGKPWWCPSCQWQFSEEELQSP